MLGRRIRRIEVVHPDVLRESTRAFADRVRGREIRSVTRRGKNVVLHLTGEFALVVNLGMTGRLLAFPAAPERRVRPTHPAVRFRFADGGVLVFDDQRRFGAVECLDRRAWRKRSRALGPEPLARAFSARALHEATSRSRTAIRTWLLDQRRIAGVGNIYASEALHLAGIHPARPASSLTREEAGRLHRSLRSVLRAAIVLGGTTIRDYRNARGEQGNFSRRLRVYGRNGHRCPRCGATVERISLHNRAAFFCPVCQPAVTT